MRRVVAVVVLVILAGLGTASTAGVTARPVGDALTPTPLDAADNGTETNNSTGVTLGAAISSFMQTNAERAGETVRHGMWTAAFERSDGPDRDALAEKRVTELQGRLENLSDSRQALLAARQNGTISQAVFVARMRALQARTGAIEESIQGTATVLERARVAPPGLSKLEADARNASPGAGPGMTPGAGTPPVVENGTGPPMVGPGNPKNATGPPGENATVTPGLGGDGPPGRNGTGPPGQGPDGPPEQGPNLPPGHNETGPPNGSDGGPGVGGPGDGPSGSGISISPDRPGDQGVPAGPTIGSFGPPALLAASTAALDGSAAGETRIGEQTRF